MPVVATATVPATASMPAATAVPIAIARAIVIARADIDRRRLGVVALAVIRRRRDVAAGQGHGGERQNGQRGHLLQDCHLQCRMHDWVPQASVMTVPAAA